MRRVWVSSAVFACALANLGGSPAQSTSTIALLDRYLAGDFDGVVGSFGEQTNYGRILKDLKRDADEWMAAGGAGERARRELAAATFALEAARAGEWYEWKWVVTQSDGPLPVIYWKAPPLLIEWGCELLRQETTPGPIERIWQLAALGVAQRGEDPQFQIGDTKVDLPAPVVQLAAPRPSFPPGGRVIQRTVTRHPDEVLNVQHEIKHLMHVTDRFPVERRFMLGQGIARERHGPADAAAIYNSLADDPAVGAEARVRLGALYLRQNRPSDALQQFDRAERETRDTYVVYLARYFRGQAFLRLKQEDNAIAAFRGAVAARPGTQSASAALAPLLIKKDQRAEAQALMAAVLEAGARAYDPYLEFMHADDRFWPRLVGRLRAEIRR